MYSTSSASRVMVASGSAASYLGTSEFVMSTARMNAVETVVPKRGVNTLIPALKAAGAQDILEIPISKIVE